MQYIKRLTPELVDDYLHFFDTTPHSTNKDEHKCYCVCWCGESCEGADFSTAAKRREAAEGYVKSGSIQGYLAYFEDRVVGWCNANTKVNCFECMSWQMFMQLVQRDEAASGIKTKSVFCFAIAPEMRGMGIASQLLRRVCEDAAKEGFDYVEAYPNREFIDTEQDFMGPVELYRKTGFTACYEAGDRLVMRYSRKV